MRLLSTVLVVLLAASLAQPAHAAPAEPAAPRSPAVEVLHVARGVFATGAQVATWAACAVALDDSDTCVKLADRVMKVASGT